MQNQAAVEALYSATMVEDYLDVVENLPNELQRHLSALRELDLRLRCDFLGELDQMLESLESEATPGGQRQVLARIRRGLIAAQDIGDDKLRVAQAIADAIENRARLLEHDAKNLDFEDDDDEEEEEEPAPAPVASSAPARGGKDKASLSGSASGRGGGGAGQNGAGGGGDGGGGGGGGKGGDKGGAGAGSKGSSAASKANKRQSSDHRGDSKTGKRPARFTVA